ncbi:MBL fold metallo-hydrolase [Streptomyces sp. NPDC057445]|uniref:MBL fold metallo-hydrolase n=1 Tax=Streptomyces sp. NPDC057445 TaxID=3346136 RepID=UPI0036C0390C
MRVHKVRPDIGVLSDSVEVPGIGYLPVNSFVLLAAEPVVVDTGLGLSDRNFPEALGSVMDPADVRWIWLTHPDRDHTGGIFELLAAAPEARVVCTFGTAGFMSYEQPLPLERLYLLNPGQSLDVGDRRLTGFRPPLYDSPTTLAFFDDRSGACFSSDCFGGPTPTVDLAEADDVSEVDPEDLEAAQLLWATVDSPWVQHVDPRKYLGTFQPIRERDPGLILSSHLPPAPGITGRLIETLGSAAGATPWVGPDQAALELMLSGFEPDADIDDEERGRPDGDAPDRDTLWLP